MLARHHLKEYAQAKVRYLKECTGSKIGILPLGSAYKVLKHCLKFHPMFIMYDFVFACKVEVNFHNLWNTLEMK